MYKILPLTDVVPIFKIYELKDESTWVDDLKDLGNKGEEIISLYFQEKYCVIPEKQKDYIGYDYKVSINNSHIYLEVKTTDKNHFFMSINEINTAKEKGSDYQIYFVCLKNKIEGTIYVIENPFVTLGLNKVFETTNSNDTARLKIGSIEVEILNFESFKRIDDEISRAVIKQVMDDSED